MAIDAEHPVPGALIMQVSVYAFLGKPRCEEVGMAFHTSGIVGKGPGGVQTALGLPIDLANILKPLAINILNTEPGFFRVELSSPRGQVTFDAMSDNSALV